MKNNDSDNKGFARRFIDYLGGLADDRGAMADLRRGFSPTTEHRAWPHVALWCDLTRERDRRILVTVAAGFAVHGRCGGEAAGSMGKALRELATAGGRGLDGLATFDGRFRRFLSCATAQEVCDHLPGVIRAAERKGVAVDFSRLSNDLHYWGEHVKVRWARDYWGSEAEGEEGREREEEAAG